MDNNKTTIVIEDANIWISYLVGTRFGQIIDALDDPSYRFLICPELIKELKDVISRPKFRKWFNEDFAQSIIDTLEQKCSTLIIENHRQPLLRDPKDAYLINLAEQGCADILVSNDDDILDLKKSFKSFQIMSLAEFISFYESHKTTKTAIMNKADIDTLTSLGIDEPSIKRLEQNGRLEINFHNYRPAMPWDEDVPKVKSKMRFSFHDGNVYVLVPGRNQEMPIKSVIRDANSIAFFSRKETTSKDIPKLPHTKLNRRACGDAPVNTDASPEIRSSNTMIFD